MSDKFCERYKIEYFEDITKQEPGHARQYLGRRHMACEVEVSINLNEIAAVLGARAARSVGGKCQDGYVAVKRVGQPKELSREMRAEPLPSMPKLPDPIDL